MRRNPQRTEGLPEWLTGGRTVVTEEHIRKWFVDNDDYVVGCSTLTNCFSYLHKRSTVLWSVGYKELP